MLCSLQLNSKQCQLCAVGEEVEKHVVPSMVLEIILVTLSALF